MRRTGAFRITPTKRLRRYTHERLRRYTLERLRRYAT